MKTRQLRITVHYRGESGSASIPLTVVADEGNLDPTALARLARVLLLVSAQDPDRADKFLTQTDDQP